MTVKLSLLYSGVAEGISVDSKGGKEFTGGGIARGGDLLLFVPALDALRIKTPHAITIIAHFIVIESLYVIRCESCVVIE
eukprot:CAMPEP_0114304966 /NCGR_PEP_ID=MMETSP0059-20121206/16078_1 /TAXON_ID=36894 /ORGANISM="Pyramimonas parkeae, Strain CCMP726" /LENGTH=79 /DNA_ID=CAMNT_0001428119 /DNA_START=555 /DNA_END=794 /DNA_ORIENTATION=+